MLNGSRAVGDWRRLTVTMHQFSLATVTTDAVVTWTRRHIGPLTSLSEPTQPLSRVVTLPIGEPGQCMCMCRLFAAAAAAWLLQMPENRTQATLVLAQVLPSIQSSIMHP